VSKEYRHIGKATPRKDAREIVTGKAQYIDDITVPNMLYGKILGSPYPHARIKHIDTGRAEAYLGVKAVLTYQDAPDWRIGTPRHRRCLDSTLHFVGDAVALVAAETAEIAEDALGLIEVEYEQLPAVYDVEEALKPDSPQVYAEFPGNLIPPGTYGLGPKALQQVVMGDVEQGFKEADFIVEGTCIYDNIPNPLPPEPPGVIVSWEGPEKITIWMASQSVPIGKTFLLPALGLIDIRIIGTHCGGSYGTKNANQILVLYAAALAQATSRPVKVYYTKEEHFNTFTLRLGSRIRGKVGMKKDGAVTALEGEWFVDTGAASESSPQQVAVGCGEVQLVVRCPNWNL
jgi:CO/xanthine dehydrogenase Mo-binding subunit